MREKLDLEIARFLEIHPAGKESRSTHPVALLGREIQKEQWYRFGQRNLGKMKFRCGRPTCLEAQNSLQKGGGAR